jgi:hypothetical protein
VDAADPSGHSGRRSGQQRAPPCHQHRDPLLLGRGELTVAGQQDARTDLPPATQPDMPAHHPPPDESDGLVAGQDTALGKVVVREAHRPNLADPPRPRDKPVDNEKDGHGAWQPDWL